ncbi:MAG TPA: hypothetical protein VGY31_05115 [Terriglobia bacterium]|nr:hypothetical protein [Terriglobia bacterium]
MTTKSKSNELSKSQSAYDVPRRNPLRLGVIGLLLQDKLRQSLGQRLHHVYRPNHGPRS